MASSVTVPQLLIHEGELNEILRMIKCEKDPEVKIIGNLFGLWRNSLIQPVVQLITGPGKRAKTSRRTFSPDHNYHDEVKNYFQEQHGLLQIGIWCSGSVNRYSRLNQASSDFNLRTPLIPEKGRYVVLLFVDCTQGNVEIEYHIVDRQRRELSRVANLTAKDVLPGPSCFRLLEPVFERINYGAMLPSKHRQNTGYFSTGMLQVKNHQHPPTTTRSTSSVMVQPVAQWYENEAGNSLLKQMVDGLKAHVPAEMSRDSSSHDITLEINRCISLHFPIDFPESGVSLSWLGDTARFQRNSDDMCRTIVNRALNVISHETALRHTTTL